MEGGRATNRGSDIDRNALQEKRQNIKLIERAPPVPDNAVTAPPPPTSSPPDGLDMMPASFTEEA